MGGAVREDSTTGLGSWFPCARGNPDHIALGPLMLDAGNLLAVPDYQQCNGTNEQRDRTRFWHSTSSTVGAARSGRIRRRGLKTRSNFAVRSLLNSILPVAAIAIGGRLVLGMCLLWLSEVPRQQRPCLASPGGHPFPSRRSRGSQRASLSRQSRSWASSRHSRP